jgi:hypothetical protein
MKTLASFLMAFAFAIHASATPFGSTEWIRSDSTGFEVNIFGYAVGASATSPNGRWTVWFELEQLWDFDDPETWTWMAFGPHAELDREMFWINWHADFTMDWPYETKYPQPLLDRGWHGTAAFYELDHFLYGYELTGDPLDDMKHAAYRIHVVATGPAAWRSAVVPDSGSTALMLAGVLGLLLAGRRVA